MRNAGRSASPQSIYDGHECVAPLDSDFAGKWWITLVCLRAG